MFLGFVAGLGLAWYSGWFEAVFDSSTEPLGVLVAATVACLVGLVDDIKEHLGPGQDRRGEPGRTVVGGWWGQHHLVQDPVLRRLLFCRTTWHCLLSVIWVLGMANAVNFIDGLDGLAAGIVGIGAAALPAATVSGSARWRCWWPATSAH